MRRTLLFLKREEERRNFEFTLVRDRHDPKSRKRGILMGVWCGGAVRACGGVTNVGCGVMANSEDGGKRHG